MKYIDDLIEEISEELNGAMEYYEESIIYKAKGNTTRASQYHDMAKQELNHAAILRDYAIQDVDALKRVNGLTEEDREHWEKCLKKLTERHSIIHNLTL